MDDIQQLATGIGDALKSIGTEFTSVWLLIQLGAILLAGVIGTLAAMLIRRRVDAATLGMGSLPVLRQLTRLLLANIGTIIFVLVLAIC